MKSVKNETIKFTEASNQKKNMIKVIAFISFTFLFFTLTNADSGIKDLKLKQVVILSRHNIRTPVEKDLLSKVTTKTWPEWKDDPGYLTSNGAILEEYMGAYFAEWLKSESLIAEKCPSEEEIYSYANVKQRTLATAKAFTLGAFPACKIPIHHVDLLASDPVFNPTIKNKTQEFKMAALQQMQQKLVTFEVKETLIEIENMLNYKESVMCTVNKKCSLTDDENVLDIVPGVEPIVTGPLRIANVVTDAFVLQYYEGFDDVAWGLITDEKLKEIMYLGTAYHNIVFNTTIVAYDIGKLLKDYIKNEFVNPKHKITLLNGHDANIYVLLNLMNFKPYELDDQYQIIPIGGKIVFQKWYNELTGEFWAKVEYVYQTSKQLRNKEVLTLLNQPSRKILELNGIETDVNGFFLWSDFVKVFN